MRVQETGRSVRALARGERAELYTHIAPLLHAESAVLRIEAANALAQMKATNGGLGIRRANETVLEVRAALFEALGRIPNPSLSMLLTAFSENATVRLGAVKGIEIYLRTHDVDPSIDARLALRQIVRESESTKIRQLALLALNRADDRDVETLEAAWLDDDPRVAGWRSSDSGNGGTTRRRWCGMRRCGQRRRARELSEP